MNESGMNPAPVALFVFKRARHTRKTIEALKENDMAGDTRLYVFSDGARGESDQAGVREVRDYVGAVSGFKSISLIERSENLGLSQSVIAGVTQVSREHGRVIVLEDDMVSSRHFLRFMNDALDRYEDEQKVVSVHGYIYPVSARLPETFFLRGADCWGWGTWKRGWDLFEPDGRKLLREIERRGLAREFDLDGDYPFTNMLRDQVRGRNQSWAVRWHASAFVRDKLTLYPGQSLIQNIGNDDTGTHCVGTDAFDVRLAERRIEVRDIAVEEDRHARHEVGEYLKGQRPDSWASRLARWRKVLNVGQRRRDILRDFLPPICLELYERRRSGIRMVRELLRLGTGEERQLRDESQEILESVKASG